MPCPSRYYYRKMQHLLMCNDGCIIGYAYQTNDEGNDGELQHHDNQ